MQPYFSGLSYRKVSRLGGFSYEAVRLWYNALKDALPERKNRRCIAVDETKAKLGKEQFFIWAARDTKEVLAFRVSFTSLDAELFLKEVLKYCKNRPL